MSQGGALSGIRVLECAHFIAGPRCAQLLADHGAEVIKLEPPGGDPSRRSPPILAGWSLYFAAHNRSKKSVAADLKQPAGRKILNRLIQWADVIITNYTPGASERLGLDFASASQVNPRIVVVRISAYGLTGPDRAMPGFDGTVQARSGLAHMVGPPDRPPTVSSVPVVDFMVAVEGAYGAMLGLRQRDMTGHGTEIDVSMMDAASTVLGYLYSEVLVSGKDPKRTGSRAPYALTGAYASADGHLYIAPIGDPAWRALCELIGQPDWGAPGAEYLNANARLRDRDMLEAAIESWTTQSTGAQLVQVLGQAGIPCAVINSVADATSDPVLAERDMIRQVDLGASGVSVPMPGVEIKLPGSSGTRQHPVVPELGADTQEVLRQLGFSDNQLDEWRAESAIIQSGTAGAPDQ
jgi:CoA:oxalate CoA-transferase